MMIMAIIKTKIKMKLISKNTISIYKAIPRGLLLFIVGLTFVAGSSFAGIKYVNAQSLQEQINDLQAQNDESKNEVEKLIDEASSYEDVISKLKARIDGLQSQINTNVSEQKKLQKQIELTQIELDEQKDLLGANIRAMYVEGDISTIEMLASSKDLSEFVDKQQYRNSVKNKIVGTLDKINALKDELKVKKEKVDTLIKEQQSQRADLADSKQKNQQLLSANSSQRNEINSRIEKNQDKINELQRQQAIENAKLFGGGTGVLGGGGYPWGNAPCIHTGQVEGACYNYDWSMNGSIWNWQTGGYGYRNCTDWVSYRIRSTGRFVPGGLGNAKLWDDRAPGYGYSVGSTPRVGAAAVSNSGYYGHIMYVEAVNGDGSIVVSDYNRAGTGKYAINTLSASTAQWLSYVYF